jgi:hypothetical protein
MSGVKQLNGGAYGAMMYQRIHQRLALEMYLPACFWSLIK